MLWIRLVLYTKEIGSASVLISLLWILLSTYSASVFLYVRFKIKPVDTIKMFISRRKERARAFQRGYSPLNFKEREIRLLVLHPGDPGMALDCELVVCSLDSHPPYEALSHTWDKNRRPENCRTVRIGGKQHQSANGSSYCDGTPTAA